MLVGGTLLIVIPGPVLMLAEAEAPPLKEAPRKLAVVRPPRPRLGGGLLGRPRELEADLMSMLPTLRLGTTMELFSLILFSVVMNLLSVSRYQPPGGGLMVPLS